MNPIPLVHWSAYLRTAPGIEASDYPSICRSFAQIKRAIGGDRRSHARGYWKANGTSEIASDKAQTERLAGLAARRDSSKVCFMWRV